MYKVKYSTAADRGEEKIVNGDVTMKEFLTEHGGNTGTLLFNGSPLVGGEEKTFSELADFYGVADGGQILLFDAPKTANGQ